MRFLGSFYNPEYAGEGFAFDEGDNGTVLLHFYSYKKGAQFWLFGVGHRSGNVALVECWEPVGGDLSNKIELKKVQELPWGKITLTEIPGDKISVEFAPKSETPWVYVVESAHKLTAPPIIVPEPVVDPEPVIEPVVELTTKVLLEKWLEAGDKSRWIDMGYPLNSSMDVPASRIGNKSYEWTKNRITVLKGDLPISSVSTGGPNNPRLTGISSGRTYHEGDVIELSLFVGPLDTGETKGFAFSNYNIASSVLGKFFNVSAQVMYSL